MRLKDQSVYIPFHLSQIPYYADDAIVAFTNSFQICSWNPAAERIFGYKGIAVLGKNLLDIISSSSSMNKDLDMLQRILNGEVVEQGAVQRKNQEDAWFFASAKGFPNINKKGEAIGGIVMLRSQSMEIYLSEYMKEMQELGGIVGWELQPLDRSLKFTEGAAEILSPEADNWKSFSELTHFFNRETRPRLIEGVEKTLVDGEPSQVSLKSSDNNGNERFFAVRWRAETVDQMVVRVFGIIRDTTKEEHYREAIAQQEAQIVARNRLAAVGELAAGVAHEINNPLAIVSGCLQLLADKSRSSQMTPESSEKLFEKIEGGIQRISGIIKTLLRFSRPDISRPRKKVNLKDILEDTLVFYSKELRDAKVRVHRDHMGDKFNVFGISSEIGQVMLNIIKNACEFMVSAEVDQPEIFFECHTTPDGWISFSIANKGPKIQPEVAAHLFEPFYTTKGVGEGTGLGMSVSYTIMNSHEGRLYIDINKRMTTFVLEFPPIEKPEDLDSKEEGLKNAV